MEEIIQILIDKFKSELSNDCKMCYNFIPKESRSNAFIKWLKFGIDIAEWEISLSYFKNTNLESLCIEQYNNYLKLKIQNYEKSTN
jgi:hypothetical protein